jgi:hypothetical protein
MTNGYEIFFTNNTFDLAFNQNKAINNPLNSGTCFVERYMIQSSAVHKKG